MLWYNEGCGIEKKVMEKGIVSISGVEASPRRGLEQVSPSY